MADDGRGAALARDRLSYRRLLVFTHLLAGGLTALHLGIGLTPLFRVIVLRGIGAPPEILGIGRTAFLLMIPWTGAIAYRRLWQGVLIRFHRTGVVPVTIATRLVVSAAVLSLGYAADMTGVHAAAAALSAGVVTAAAAAWLFCRPVLTVGLARSPDPVKSLAAWPVILSVLFMGRSVALSFQEAVVALLTADITRSVMINVAVLVGVMVLLGALAPVPGALLFNFR